MSVEQSARDYATCAERHRPTDPVQPVGEAVKQPLPTCARTGIPASFCTCSAHEVAHQLDARAYAQLAQQHRPTGEAGMRVAARELARRGMRLHDIASALQVSPAVVQSLLAPSAETANAHAATWRRQHPGGSQ